ncbi:MAG: heavy-metal-associated domain-containing protein [Bryobacteraceae bacterium]
MSVRVWIPGLLLAAAPALAEFRTIDQRFGGISCDSCAASLEKSISRMRGVESIEISMEGGVARVRLKEGNTIQLDALRDRFKAVGFTPGEADVTAVGIPRLENGAWSLELETGLKHPLVLGEEEKRRSGDLERAPGGTIVVHGRAGTPANPIEPAAIHVTRVDAGE